MRLKNEDLVLFSRSNKTRETLVRLERLESFGLPEMIRNTEFSQKLSSHELLIPKIQKMLNKESNKFQKLLSSNKLP